MKLKIKSTALIYLCILAIFLSPGCNDSEDANDIDDSISVKDIIIYGDTRTDHENHQIVVDAIVAENPKYVFHTGDLVDHGEIAEEWIIFNEITAELQSMAEFYPVLGNHEDNSQNYFDNFELPNNEIWYSVEIENLLFIILDSNIDITSGSEQYIWLENELKEGKDSDKFIMTIKCDVWKII